MNWLSIRTIVVATGNAHKVGEIRAIARSLAESKQADGTHTHAWLGAVEWLSLGDLGHTFPEPVEDGATFAANAAIKARAYARLTGQCCLADDSGLCVESLAGEPGVMSARYSGHVGPREEVDRENNRVLLRKLGLRPVEDRRAAFVCTMALACPPVGGAGGGKGGSSDAAGPLVASEGRVEGRILGPGDEGFEAWHPDHGFDGRGHNGFGYDPLFLIPELGRTTAELSSEHKNQISHRGRAFRAMVAAMEQASRGGR